MPESYSYQILHILITAAFSAGAAWGATKFALKNYGERLDKHDMAIASLTPTSYCEKCRADCERRNARAFMEIKTLLGDISDKRDDYVTALGDVSCRLGRIEGKLER